MDIETSDGSGTIIERITDNGDGTGTLTNSDGETLLTGLPIPEPEPPSPELVAAQEIRSAIASSIVGATTVEELQAAILDGLDIAIANLGGVA
ncbi:hypothetical protein UFOVP1279_17 [uncultured Caudovirales phage]|uniref:Uncharacterized protein n=1 Tax=uncultured Caudovirales phage TaxID=2100421 RepID=A0A6J5RGC0_9CAUD|nr:hypothetical protein UFOVP1279_17 [uncultured Caudovirales phage]